MAAPRSAGQPTPSSAGQPAQSSAGHLAPALEVPPKCKEFWARMRTSNRAKINPAYHPRNDDGSDRCMVVQCNIMDTAVYHDPGAHARQIVRNILRKRPVLTFDSEREHLENIIRSENFHNPKFKFDDQRKISEWLTTALRHKPLHRGQLSDIFIREVTTYDEYDGWGELCQLLNILPAEGSG
eukprot:7306708-Pyramimonas_sp.AAC.1